MASRQKHQEVLEQITNRSLKHIMIQNSFDVQTYSRKDETKGTHCSLPLLFTIGLPLLSTTAVYHGCLPLQL
jgi:hypothetical protein